MSELQPAKRTESSIGAGADGCYVETVWRSYEDLSILPPTADSINWSGWLRLPKDFSGRSAGVDCR
jgi:hypothetical protein